jgi:hypothetical protein
VIATKPKTYLTEVIVHDAADIESLAAGDAGIASCISTKSPRLVSIEGQPERLLLPVFNGSELLSVVSLQIGTGNDLVGVTEIWEPVGPYEEVKLTAGSFGPLERFQNVSSFVRFEKGNGLPGQVWETTQSVIHDELANHPGFLRAAGASAGSLETAIGIPVFSDRFVATVVLIGSVNAPIANACEVWARVDERYELQSARYQACENQTRFEVGQSMGFDAGLFGLVNEHRGAAISTNKDTLLAERSDWQEIALGLAIPSYVDGKVTSVTKLLF